MLIKFLISYNELKLTLLDISADFENGYVGDEDMADAFIAKCYENSRVEPEANIPITVIESVALKMLGEGGLNDLLDTLRIPCDDLDKLRIMCYNRIND